MTPTEQDKEYQMTLDEQIDEILAKFAIQILGQFTGATALGVDEFKAKDTIKDLIANKVREARIDELKRFDRSSEEMTKLIPLKIGERLYELTKQEEQE